MVRRSGEWADSHSTLPPVNIGSFISVETLVRLLMDQLQLSSFLHSYVFLFFALLIFDAGEAGGEKVSWR